MKAQILFIPFFTILCLIRPGTANPSALDDYIAAADPNYSYEHVATISRFGYTGYVLDMTSQVWRTADEVDHTEWHHWVTIVIPAIVSSDKALLVIVGADNDDPYDADTVDFLGPLALAEGAVVAAVEMVPNQPLQFADETEPRSSDAIIAYSWDKFFSTGDPTWIVQLPMTKSAVRAMDSIQAFCSALTPALTVSEFVVAGASKHGWTAWLTAAVDSRVTAVIPLVIDLLNIDVSFRHHHAAYGFWATAVGDYEAMQIFDHIGTPEMAELTAIIDPYVYRDRLTMPRFIVNSAGDEFFLPDSSQFYYHDLPPVGSLINAKYLRYLPNTGHGLSSAATFETLAMFFHAALSGTTLPRFDWSFSADGQIDVQTAGSVPSEVRLWQASNPVSRDFRYSTIGNTWTSTALIDSGGGNYVGSVTAPGSGWTAFFIELRYPSGSLFDYSFTTDIKVLPERLPYAADIDFDGELEGDVDDNGVVSLNDAIRALQISAGLKSFAVAIEADYDGDRRIGLADGLWILSWLADHQ